MRFCYLPNWCIVTFAVVIIMASLIYTMILGVMTGIPQIFVGILLVGIGVVGIFIGMIRKRFLALIYMLAFCIVWVIAVAINIMGIVKPKALSTFDAEYVIGSVTLKPGYEWFLGGLLFTLICCTPCLCISICNCATIKNLTDYRQYKKKKRQEKEKRREAIKPIIQRLEVNDASDKKDGEKRKESREERTERKRDTTQTINKRKRVGKKRSANASLRESDSSDNEIP